MKKKFIILTIVFFLPLLSITVALASDDEMLKTPYGDFCSHFRHYGSSKKMHNHKQSEKSLKHYFKSKGLDVVIFHSKDRFIKANVKNKNKIVDTVIFDRITGRVRSIY
jgi:hypothetical protein